MTPARVLIVDDDPTLLEALSETLALRMNDVSVDTSKAAQPALRRIARTDYDAIVADIKMPGMDGLELLGRIRELRPDTPTLLITGHGEHDLAVRALRGGAHDYVQKPIDRDYFVASLSHAMEVRRLGRQVARQKQALEQDAAELQQCLEERSHELRELYQRESLARAELEEAHHRREELVGMVAHDLGLPLTTLRGYVELLARPNVPAATQDRARAIIIAETGRMARLVQDLVDASRVATHQFQLEPKTADLVSTVREQVELAAARSRQHTFNLQAPDALPMQFDPDRLAQVFRNLLANAIDHTSGGEIHVRVWTERKRARFSVRDQGPGIPPESLENIFNPRVRLNGHGAGHRPNGAGLGLSIARAIVEAHRGRIWAESAPGQGATFNVGVPLLSPVRSSKAERGPRAPAARARVRLRRAGTREEPVDPQL